MTAEDFGREFLAMEVKEQMEVLRVILPAFCSGMSQSPDRVMEMFRLFSEECGGEMKNMMTMMGMMGRKGGGCCGG